MAFPVNVTAEKLELTIDSLEFSTENPSWLNLLGEYVQTVCRKCLDWSERQNRLSNWQKITFNSKICHWLHLCCQWTTDGLHPVSKRLKWDTQQLIKEVCQSVAVSPQTIPTRSDQHGEPPFCPPTAPTDTVANYLHHCEAWQSTCSWVLRARAMLHQLPSNQLQFQPSKISQVTTCLI